MCWEMVGIELEEITTTTRNTADDDMFVVMRSCFEGIHLTTIHLDSRGELQITHSASVGGGDFRRRHVTGNDAFQTVFYDRFQMSRHVL